MSDGRVDYSRQDGRRTIHLYDFETRVSDWGRNHRLYLSRFASERHDPNIVWRIIGLASRLGDRTEAGRALNERLSWARARAVQNYVLRENMNSMGRGAGLVEMPNLNTRIIGVGTRMSDVEGTTRNDAYHRGVMMFNTTVQLAGVRITARVPFERHNTFYIKYVGSGGGGEAVGGNVTAFAIRDPNNYWQRYLYGGIHAGGGAPVSFGDALPPGEGWVEFRTSRRVTVEDFEGTAHMLEGGAVLGGVGISMLDFEFGRGLGSGGQSIRLSIPTGSGFAFGGSETIIGGMATAGDATHSRGWEFL